MEPSPSPSLFFLILLVSGSLQYTVAKQVLYVHFAVVSSGRRSAAQRGGGREKTKLDGTIGAQVRNGTT